jgi:uncharacterized protein (TIGR04168 family)
MVRIAVVGDVHDKWSTAIEAPLLRGLGVDLVLFVGDFGNEAVALVEDIARLDMPKAVMFGNHDAWYSATHEGKARCPYDRTKEDWVQRQLDAVGEDFVGYGAKRFEALGLTVVGARPFSWGGPDWKNSSFYQTRFGVKGFDESVEKIMAGVGDGETLIFMGHNGPAGLGSEAEAPCGKDWGEVRGDYGDPDFAVAVDRCKSLGKAVPLATFGHMHHGLRHRQDCERRSMVFQSDTLYLNAAAVPRVREMGGEVCYGYSIAELGDGVVRSASLVWVGQSGRVMEKRVGYGAV